MRKIVPTIKAQKKFETEMAGFRGMNNTMHPTLLPLNVPSNLQNSYFQDGMLKKRNGYGQFGSPPTGNIIEEFYATTYRDTPTTGSWEATLGKAELYRATTAQIDTSTTAEMFAYGNARKSVVSSNGEIVVFYQDAGGLKARMAIDSNLNKILQIGTWTDLSGSAGESTIYASSVVGWGTFIDSSNNIHVSYVTGIGSLYYILLTYNAGSWSVGSPNLVTVNAGGSSAGSCAIGVTSAGVIWVVYAWLTDRSDTYLRSKSSSDGLTWSAATNIYVTEWSNPLSVDLVINNDEPLIVFLEGYTYLYSNQYDGSSWGDSSDRLLIATIGFGTSNSFSLVKIADDSLMVGYAGAYGSIYSYNGTSWSISTTITDNTNGEISLCTNGTKVWAIHTKYENTNQLEIVYRYYNGSAWDTNYTAITADNANNDYVQTPMFVYNSVPIFWITGTSNPYSLKSYTAQISGIVQSKSYDVLTGTQTYLAIPVETLNGGTIVYEYADSADDITFSSWTSDYTTLSERYIKFKITLSTNKLDISPWVEKLTISYSGLSIVSMHSWTKPGTTEKYLLEIGGTNLYMYDEVSDTYIIIKNNLTNGLRCTSVGFSEGLKSYFVLTNGTDSVMRFNGKVSTGTITTSGTSYATVTNSGTSKWNTAGHMDQLSAGGAIKIGSSWYVIDSVFNDTVLYLVGTGPAVTNSTYEGYGINTLGGLSTAGIGGGELKGKYITAYKNQLMISGIPNYESWVQVSAYLSGTTWSYSVDGSGNPTFTNGSGAINVSTNDGQIVTALVPFGNSVQVHKSDIYYTKKSVYSLTRSTETWTNYAVSTQYAAVSQYATVTGPNAVYFVDSSGIVMTNGVTFQKMDNDIAATTALFNKTYIKYAIAAYNVQEGSEFLFFGVPISSSVTNDYLLMYDISNKGWGIMNGLNMGCFAIYSDVYTPELYFGDQLATSRILKWNSGTSDDGQPIEWIVETSELPIKQYFERKKFKYLYAFFEPTGSFDVLAYYSLDGAAYVQLTDAVETSGSDDVFKRWNLPGLNGSSVKFKFYNNEKDEPITLVRAGVVSIDKGLRRI